MDEQAALGFVSVWVGALSESEVKLVQLLRAVADGARVVVVKRKGVLWDMRVVEGGEEVAEGGRRKAESGTP